MRPRVVEPEASLRDQANKEPVESFLDPVYDYVDRERKTSRRGQFPMALMGCDGTPYCGGPHFILQLCPGV